MKIIFDGAYSSAFTDKAAEGNHVLGDENDRVIDPKYYANHKELTSKALEMFLLADNVHLVGADVGLNYDKLIDSGFVTIEDVDFREKYRHDRAKDLLNNEDFLTYVRPIKPIIIKHIECGIAPRFQQVLLQDFNLNISSFVDALFEYIINNDVSTDIYKRSSEALWSVEPSGIKKRHQASQSFSIFAEGFLPLMAYMVDLFQIVEVRQGIICSNSINDSSFQVLDKDSILNNTNKIAEACGILRVSLGDAIGYIPKLDSVEQVLRMKDSKSKEIAGLNEAISELVQSLKDGHISGAQKAKQLITLASKDLARSQNIAKTETWATFLALPVTIVEILTGIPPVTGIGLASLCAGGAIYRHLSSKKRWISIYL